MIYAILATFGVSLTVVTGMSLIESYQWWIRIWDFPRVQLLVAMLGVIVALVFVAGRGRWWLIAALGIASAWQMYRIFPYTPFGPSEVPIAAEIEGVEDDQCFSLMSLNVLQTNRDYAATIALIRDRDPDLLLLLETDRGWADALAPVLARYPHRVDKILDNKYGLMFATRLAVDDARIGAIIDAETPSVFARLRTRRGDAFEYMGLHPRPPRPGQDTDKRDAEIAIAATQARAMNIPVLANGDFNDVAWSHTSQLFKRIGGYLDPRIGRGTFPTFPAALPFLRWPLDHLYITPEFRVRALDVERAVGSDHLPVSARLCLAPAAAHPPAPTTTREDAEDLNEILDQPAAKTPR